MWYWSPRRVAEHRLVQKTSRTYRLLITMIVSLILIGAILVGTRIGIILVSLGIMLIIVALPIVTYNAEKKLSKQDIDREITKISGKDGYWGKGAHVSKPIYKIIAIIFISLFVLATLSAIFG